MAFVALSSFSHLVIASLTTTLAYKEINDMMLLVPVEDDCHNII